MRSTLAIVLTISLLGTGALVAVDLATVLRPGSSIMAPHLADATGPDRTSVVRGFYDAANALLAGEDALALTAVVAPRVETHSGREAPTIGADALAERLAALQRQGGVRLSVVQVAGNGADVTALIEAHEAARSAPVSPGNTAPPLWRTIDRFRIDGGMIAGYWPGAIESRPLPPLPAMTIPAPAEHVAISLARLELGPDVSLRALATSFPQLILVENGTVLISRRGVLAVSRAGDPGFTWKPAVPVAEEMLLGPGDAALIPAGAGQVIINREDRPASALSLLVAPLVALYGPKHDLSQDTLTMVAMHEPARIGRRTSWVSGVTSQTLAVGMIPTEQTAGEIALAGEHLALEPGDEARSLTPTALTFTIVQSGTLTVRNEKAPAPGALTSTPPSHPGADQPGNRLLRAGDAIVLDAGDVMSFENAGATRLDLMLIAASAAGNPGAPTLE